METSRRFLATGGMHPRGWPNGRSQRRAECLIEGSEPRIELTACFAQPIERQVLDAAGEPVAGLEVTGRRYTSGVEITERAVELSAPPSRTAAVRAAGGERAELRENGALAGAVVWRWQPLHVTVEAWVEEIGPGLRRLRVDLANRIEWGDGPRERVLLLTPRATRVLIHSPDGAFASLNDPPAHLREHSAACRNEGLWPVPVGEAGDRRTMLAAPIPLEDYPSFARRSKDGSRDLVAADGWPGAGLRQAA